MRDVSLRNNTDVGRRGRRKRERAEEHLEWEPVVALVYWNTPVHSLYQKSRRPSSVILCICCRKPLLANPQRRSKHYGPRGHGLKETLLSARLDSDLRCFVVVGRVGLNESPRTCSHLWTSDGQREWRTWAVVALHLLLFIPFLSLLSFALASETFEGRHRLLPFMGLAHYFLSVMAVTSEIAAQREGGRMSSSVRYVMLGLLEAL